VELGKINELTKIAYNRTAGKYLYHFKDEIIQKEYDRLILDRFSGIIKVDSMICDAGCGPAGHIGKYLAEKGHKVVGIDISQKCIDLATETHPEIEFRVMDISKTDFKDETFDAIISFYSILYTPKEHVNKIFAEFNRILKKGGKLLVVVKKGTEEGIIDDEWYEGNNVYFTHFVEEEIGEYLTNNNFKSDFMATRKPYDFEIDVERIYSISTKL
jgi:ubiquinone/menaquinone biosynthesis C-methylase UbiE